MKTSFLLTAGIASLTVIALGTSAASAAPLNGNAPLPSNSSLTTPIALNLPALGSAATPDASTDADTVMTAVLKDVDEYWTRKFTANDIAEPSVSYHWIPVGESVQTACSNEPTDDEAAFYCPADDTIYVADAFADAVRDDGLSRWPSGDRTTGPLGNMAIAYMVAHEEAHNIQTELGIFNVATDTKSTELQADCMAGAWAHDAAQRGVVSTDDESIAETTAWLVGDNAIDSPGHHGTPEERQEAFSSGYQSLSSCWSYTA